MAAEILGKFDLLNYNESMPWYDNNNARGLVAALLMSVAWNVLALSFELTGAGALIYFLSSGWDSNKACMTAKVRSQILELPEAFRQQHVLFEPRFWSDHFLYMHLIKVGTKACTPVSSHQDISDVFCGGYTSGFVLCICAYVVGRVTRVLNHISKSWILMEYVVDVACFPACWGCPRLWKWRDMTSNSWVEFHISLSYN